MEEEFVKPKVVISMDEYQHFKDLESEYDSAKFVWNKLDSINEEKIGKLQKSIDLLITRNTALHKELQSLKKTSKED